MKFEENRPIYLQIVAWICEKVLRGEWHEGERIPSVRELGALLQVNPNTVMRAYERLQAEQVIYNQRGIGYFVAQDAVQGVLGAQRAEFLESELPRLLDRMMLLSITPECLTESYKLYLENHSKHENTL
ncbi:MAG: GntR family transcriptional regulator [Alistipes sp.]|nr:GntR family transcriptional regulator [Alistipes sp.]